MAFKMEQGRWCLTPEAVQILHYPPRDSARIANLLNPLAGTQGEVGKACLHPKVVKFDHFEIGIVYQLPRAKELDGIAGTYPVLDDIGHASRSSCEVTLAAAFISSSCAISV